ncbi:MAG TPA: hypothetical protein VKB80_04940 [Kofleriaceae bacterium]|nr:hypothetical protein [Kofleriaceae bacterium]
MKRNDIRDRLVWLVLAVAFAVWVGACAVDSAAAIDDEAISEQQEEIGGGGGICGGLAGCYCFCRLNHRCDQTPSQCGPLSQCLDGCDDSHPGCPYPGGDYPDSPADCL